jgi:hypothetical protein
MRNSQYFRTGNPASGRVGPFGALIQKKALVGIVLIVALLAFEIFNFDTTQYALRSLLGEIRFLGLQWATILAIAFCAIDFAGLIRIFTPERGDQEPKEVWYLTGAWLLGATMNAIMTWWAVSLALLNHPFGNEVLSREQLLLYVPIFVAVLVWLTRILFIGAFSVAGEHIFDFHAVGQTAQPAKNAAAQPTRTIPRSTQPQPTAAPTARPRTAAPKPKPRPTTPSPSTGYIEELQYEPIAAQPSQATPPQPQPQPQPVPAQPRTEPMSRVRQRPPRPANGRTPGMTSGYQAQPHNKQ